MGCLLVSLATVRPLQELDFSLSASPDRSGSFPCALGRTCDEAAAHWLVASPLRVGMRVLVCERERATAPAGLAHEYYGFVERAMIATGIKVTASMATDVLGLSEEQ